MDNSTNKAMLKSMNSPFKYISVKCDTAPLKFCSLRYTKRILQPYIRLDFSKIPSYQLMYKTNYSYKVNKKKEMADSKSPFSHHSAYGGVLQVSHQEVTQDNLSSQNNSEPNHSSKIIPEDFRKWVNVGESNGLGAVSFKVVSYNVLAQYLLECHPYLYRCCSPEALKWDVRSKLLFYEIIKLDPDILCFQEVQIDHLKTFFKKFEDLGYTGVFKQKTGFRQDGCAIYFKKSIFTLEDQIGVEFYQPQLPILNRDNIGIMVKLIPRDMPNSPMVVATTHLLYNPKRTDVRLAQIQVFLAEIDRFSYNNTGHCPIIITGDFNSTPRSAVINLLDKGHVSAFSYRDSSDWKTIAVTDNCQHLSVYLDRQRGVYTTTHNKTNIYNSDIKKYKIDVLKNELSSGQYNELFNTGVLSHSLQLKSVYNRIKANGHREATTFQDYWVTVDYIYYSYLSGLKLKKKLRLPTVKECEVLDCLPNHVYGSDHLALGAVFEMQRDNSKCS